MEDAFGAGEELTIVTNQAGIRWKKIMLGAYPSLLIKNVFLFKKHVICVLYFGNGLAVIF